MPKTNIILTGMPGSGKSTTGVLLAKERCMKFLDTDVLIQTGEGMTLQEILDRYGLSALKEIEARYVAGLDVSNTVIAPGGSVILSETAMSALKCHGMVVFLNVPLEIIHPRIDIFTRGMVRQPGETLEDVWNTRAPLYHRHADITIDCGDKNQLEIVREIVSRLDLPDADPAQ